MNILIVDDDKEFSKKLQKDFENYFYSYVEKFSFEIKNDDFLRIDIKNFDVAFLDIDLEILNGIDLARRLKEKNPVLKIIFVSAREELVFQALSVDVFQFIRKSQYKSDVFIVFNQLAKFFQENSNKKIINYQGRQTLIYLDKIEYIISIGHDVIIHLKDKEYVYKASLKEILEFFDCSFLVQIKRNLVINLYFVKDVTKSNVVLLSGNKYEIGRSFQEKLIEHYEEFLLR